MAYYTSRHTGEAIDDAVDKVAELEVVIAALTARIAALEQPTGGAV